MINDSSRIIHMNYFQKLQFESRIWGQHFVNIFTFEPKSFIDTGPLAQWILFISILHYKLMLKTPPWLDISYHFYTIYLFIILVLPCKLQL
jgi:hypothetical protein